MRFLFLIIFAFSLITGCHKPAPPVPLTPVDIAALVVCGHLQGFLVSYSDGHMEPLRPTPGNRAEISAMIALIPESHRHQANIVPPSGCEPEKDPT